MLMQMWAEGAAMGGVGLCGRTTCEEAVFREDCYGVYEEYGDYACQLAALLSATVRQYTVKEATEAKEEHFEAWSNAGVV
jgi:hypothetical protein